MRDSLVTIGLTVAKLCALTFVTDDGRTDRRQTDDGRMTFGALSLPSTFGGRDKNHRNCSLRTSWVM